MLSENISAVTVFKISSQLEVNESFKRSLTNELCLYHKMSKEGYKTVPKWLDTGWFQSVMQLAIIIVEF